MYIETLLVRNLLVRTLRLPGVFRNDKYQLRDITMNHDSSIWIIVHPGHFNGKAPGFAVKLLTEPHYITD